METILQEVEQALNARLYYLAIATALALPDICAALESADGETRPERYRDWYTANLAAKYPNLTAQDCYLLRCGILHQGRLGHPGSQYARVIFGLPGRGMTLHCTIVNDALQLNALIFCRGVLASVRAWFAAHQNDPNVLANYPNLVQYRPQGLAPYGTGMPVIA